MALSDRRARLLARLGSNRSRAREQRVLVEGIRAVAEALAAGCACDFAVVSPRLAELEGGPELRDRIEAAGVELVEVSDRELSDLSDTETPQGVALVCREPEHRLADVVGSGSGDRAAGPLRLLVLDAVQDPGNVGTLVRSAVAFGFDGVIALSGTTDPWGCKAVRASAGLVFRVPVVRCAPAAAIAALNDATLPILAASAEGSMALRQSERGFALAVGNEGAGVRDEVRQAAARSVAVPMPGPAESLNVGIAGSILMFDLTRKDR